MSVIQKIRNKYGKLAGAIIALALVGFIFMDAASGRFGDLFGRNSNVAEVNGEKIGIKDYSLRTKQFETLYAIYNKSRPLDDATRAQMDEQSLNNLVFDRVAADQCDKIGLASTKEEEKDLIYGANPDPMVAQFSIEGNPIFNNQQTGMFDPQYVKGFEQQLPQIDPTGKIKEQWDAVKDYVINTHRTNKFNYLFINAAYTPKYLLQHSMKEKAAMAGIKYVKVPYSSIADNSLTVNDGDIKTYMEQHAALYSVTEPVRNIEYVSFDIKPSAEDTAKTINALTQIKADFAATKDNENFINSKSDEKFVEGYLAKKTIMSAFADSLINQPVGSVYGPYFENNAYKLTRLIAKKEMADSVKVRHILVRVKSQGRDISSDSAAKKKLDSAIAEIKSGVPFKDVVKKYTEDDNTKDKGGEYDFYAPQRIQLGKRISTDFADFSFDGKPGESKIIHVKNDAYEGYHYIEVVEKHGFDVVYDLGTITKNLEAGDNTNNAVYAAATEFAGNNGTADKFDAAVKKQNLSKKVGENIKMNDFTVQGLGPAREIIRWVYEAKAGDVSTVFHLDGKYVVAKLTSIQDKGLQAIDMSNRPRLEALVKSEMKAELMMKKFGSMSSLEDVAKAANQSLLRMDTVNAGQSFLPNIGYEPAVVGYVFYTGLQLNKMSPGIRGQGGVYFISVTNRWSQPQDNRQMDQVRQQQMMMESQARNGIGQSLQQTLLRKANVKYIPNNI